MRVSAKSAADGWISYAASQVERAQRAQAQAAEDDDDLPPTAKDANPRPKHPDQPQALAGNSFSDAYFAALGAIEGRRVSVQAPHCAFCARQTIGKRLTDGARSWCDTCCQQRWIAARAERNRARDRQKWGFAT